MEVSRRGWSRSCSMGLMLCMGRFGGCHTPFRRDLRVEERWILGNVRGDSICLILLMNAERARNCFYFFEIKNLRESEMSGVGSRKETREISYHNSRKGDKKRLYFLTFVPRPFIVQIPISLHRISQLIMSHITHIPTKHINTRYHRICAARQHVCIRVSRISDVGRSAHPMSTNVSPTTRVRERRSLNPPPPSFLPSFVSFSNNKRNCAA